MLRLSSTQRFLVLILAAIALVTPAARAWDDEGHVIVVDLALAKLPDAMPEWLRSPEVRQRLEYLASEPDRWRGQHSVVVDHANNPDHYFDIEQLDKYGLTLGKLPSLRREFLDALAAQRLLHPDEFPPRDAKKDQAYTSLVPGMLPYAISEAQWKIAADWTTLKTYEKHPDQVTPDMVRNARENIIHDMGILSHFVGDGSQPLHLTDHHHGWVGPNPKGYTTEHGFHQYIDGGVIIDHHITSASLAGRAKPPRKIARDDSWPDILAYLNETYQKVEPLYALEKSGDLKKAPGKEFIEDRLLDGGAMLAGIWAAAFDAGKIDEFRENQLKEKAERNGYEQGKQPTTQPAAESGDKPQAKPAEQK